MRIPLAFALAIAVSSTPAWAQDPTEPELPPPVTLTYADGRTEIARGSGVEPAQAPDVLESGDRLITGDGRAELVYADGSVVHVDRDTDLRIDPDVRLVLDRGRLVVRTTPAAAPLDIVTPSGVVRLGPDGEYLFTADDLDGDTRIAAVAGRATLTLVDRDVPIGPDDEVWIDPRSREPRWTRAGTPRDAFSDWAARRVADMHRARGSQPLPPELLPYAPSFAMHGRWDTLPTYGQVWFPTAAPGWRPYAYGSWRHTRYGWTWIDSAMWGWPVHHYGRWGRHASRGWYWMPQRTWGPAWVGWAVHADHIGWAPLGWNSRPIVDFFIGARVGPLDLWAGSWSVMPRRYLGVRGPVRPYLADIGRLPPPVLGGFVTQARPPRGPDGWSRRLSSARAYGRPTPVPRSPSRYDSRGDARNPRQAMPRVDAGRDPAPQREADIDRGRREVIRRYEAGDGAGADRRSPRDTSAAAVRRPGDARAPGDAPESRPVAPPAPRSRPERTPPPNTGGYGRPTAADTAPGRPEPARARPRAERPRATGDDRQAGPARGSGGSGSAGAPSGNRRRPRQ